MQVFYIQNPKDILCRMISSHLDPFKIADLIFFRQMKRIQISDELQKLYQTIVEVYTVQSTSIFCFQEKKHTFELECVTFQV